MHIIVVIFAYHEQEIRESHRHVRSAHHDSDQNIQNAQLIYCEGKACELITEFKLAGNNTFNCNNLYLGITFNILIMNENGNGTENIDVYSWLSNDEQGENEKYKLLSNQQKTSSICKQIRR